MCLGASVPAGIDFNDQESFKNAFPELWTIGFRSIYHLLGYTAATAPHCADETPTNVWGTDARGGVGYVADSGDLPKANQILCPDGRTIFTDDVKTTFLLQFALKVCFEWHQSSVYQYLYRILATKGKNNIFIVTTNIDGMFLLNGFDAQNMYLLHGDVGFLQCSIPCQRNIWPLKPLKMNADLNNNENKHCIYCKAPAILNIRLMGSNFVENNNQRLRYINWLRSTMGKRITILELGVSDHTPVMLRDPLEQYVMNNENSFLVRINTDQSAKCRRVRSNLLNRYIFFNCGLKYASSNHIDTTLPMAFSDADKAKNMKEGDAGMAMDGIYRKFKTNSLQVTVKGMVAPSF
jgi:NAD-dependent SIR2 family protein deacetylase